MTGMTTTLLPDLPVVTRRAGARIVLEMYRMTGRNPTGVHRYALSLAEALVSIGRAGDAVDVWTAREPRGAMSSSRVPVSTWAAPRRPLHLAWAALHHPHADRFLGAASLVHQLTNVVPVPTRRPLVVTVHDVMPLQFPDWYERAPRWAFGRALRYAAANAASLIAPSERVSLDIQDWLGVEPERITVIPEGVGSPFTQPVPPAAIRTAGAMFGVEPGRYYVVVGEVTARKNLPVLFQALAQLRGKPGALPLLVVGAPGKAAEDVVAATEDWGVTDLVRFTGRVTDPTLAALVQGARALVHPSMYEGFGLTPLEAMASGTPVVASAAGALPEVVGTAGMLVPAGHADGWAAAMATAAIDDAWAARAVAVGRARAAAFTWEAAARRTWDVYERVLAS